MNNGKSGRRGSRCPWVAWKILAPLVGALSLSWSQFLVGNEIILNEPGYPSFHATAFDQPMLDVYLTDPLNGNAVFDDDGTPIIFRAFVDTGASGMVLSHFLATSGGASPSFGFTEEEDYIGVFTEVGIGGEELGWVSRPLGVAVLDGVRYAGHEGNLDQFQHYGDFNLWVRQAPGVGEAEYMPVNIVGMPVIGQRVMVMDPTPLAQEDFGFMETYLLPPGEEAPPTNVTLPLLMRDFSGEEPPEGETFGSHAKNPLIRNVSVGHDGPNGWGAVCGDWLFDTGATSTFISFNKAKLIGLIPPEYDDFDLFVADHEEAGGLVTVVGGIGPNMVSVPILNVDEIRAPTTSGIDLVWQSVDVLIMDIPELAGLDLNGIFGMNLIVPALTLGGNEEFSPGVFHRIVFDAADEENAELRFFSPRVAGSFTGWRIKHFTAEEIADPDISGPGASLLGDGASNLLKYALGGEPLSPLVEISPVVELISDEGVTRLELRYLRPKDVLDIEYIVEVSNDLTSWAAAEVEMQVTSVDQDNEEVVARELHGNPAGTGKHFARLRVVRDGR